MPNPNPIAARAIDEALLVDAKLDRLVSLITAFRTASIKEAQETCSLKTGGMIARSQAEYDLLGVVEDVFNIDTDDRREAIADECYSETGYDPRRACHPAEDAADFADYLYGFARDAQLVRAYEQGGQA